MRADAARRRQAIIREARRLFAAQGSGVALESVAEAAGVGIATLYRNFPSRLDLIDAVIDASLEDIASGARALPRRRSSGDPRCRVAGVPRSPRRPGPRAPSRMRSRTSVAGELSDRAARCAECGARRGRSRARRRPAPIGLADDELSALELVLAIGILSRPQPEAVRALAPGLGRRLVAIFATGIRP